MPDTLSTALTTLQDVPDDMAVWHYGVQLCTFGELRELSADSRPVGEPEVVKRAMASNAKYDALLYPRLQWAEDVLTAYRDGVKAGLAARPPVEGGRE